MHRLGDTVDLAVLEGILATVLDGVIVSDRDGNIVDCSELGASIFGFEKADLIGQQMEAAIIPPDHRSAHSNGMARLKAGGKPRILGKRLELEGLHRSGTVIPIELAVTRAGEVPREIYIAFVRDISERRTHETELARRTSEAELIADVSSLAAGANSFDDALKIALEAILKLTGWPVGHAFIKPISSNLLQSSHVWVGDGRDLEAIKRKTEETVWLPGSGLPGAIFNSGEPEWIEDLRGSDFPREGLGFRSAFGFPITSAGRTIAVLEFFLDEPARKEPALLQTLRIVGDQLGRVFERKLTEDRQRLLVNELNHRVKNTIAIIQGIAKQTFVGDVDVEEAKTTFASRLNSIALAQDALNAEAWAKAPFRQILDSAISGSGADYSRFVITGPDFDVRPEVAVSISLAVHELATNAMKYGALSTSAGRVEIEWGVIEKPNAKFWLRWQELGGPKVHRPSRKGFGSRLLTRGISLYASGQVTLEYPETGFIFCYEAALHDQV
jgi:PAS domain S-box-containing protein